MKNELNKYDVNKNNDIIPTYYIHIHCYWPETKRKNNLNIFSCPVAKQREAGRALGRHPPSAADSRPPIVATDALL